MNKLAALFTLAFLLFQSPAKACSEKDIRKILFHYVEMYANEFSEGALQPKVSTKYEKNKVHNDEIKSITKNDPSCHVADLIKEFQVK